MVVVVQSFICVQLFVTPWTVACQASPSLFPRVCSNSHPLNQWCHPTISSSVSPFSSCLSLSQHQGLFQWVGSLHQVAKVLELQFSIGPSGEYSGLISFKINRFDLLVVQGTLKSLLQHCSLKASVLWHSAFFMVQLSHPYRTTGKTIALTRQTFVGKEISLIFNNVSSLKYSTIYILKLF